MAIQATPGLAARLENELSIPIRQMFPKFRPGFFGNVPVIKHQKPALSLTLGGSMTRSYNGDSLSRQENSITDIGHVKQMALLAKQPTTGNLCERPNLQRPAIDIR